VTSIDDSKMYKKDWCKYLEHEIKQLSYPTTLNYDSGNSAPIPFDLKTTPTSTIIGFETTKVCDGVAAGPFKYYLSSDNGGASPSHISVDISTG